MPLQIGIFGRGRLGSAIAAAAEQADDLQVAWLVGRDAPQDLPPVDIALEVSQADAVANRLRWARKRGTNLVIGTTGWDPALASVSGGESPAIGILIAPNFSLTVALMRRIALALGGYAELQDADLAVSEVHHTRKLDAPSGTALLLRDALARGAGREADSVQTASLRLGDVVGRHDVHLTSAAESITLTRTAGRSTAWAP